MAQTMPDPYSLENEWDFVYTNGERQASDGEDVIPVENPATGSVLTEVPDSTENDVDDAFRAAKQAQKEWAEKPPQARSEVIQKALGILQENHEEIAEINVAECGSTQAKAGFELGQLAPGIMTESVAFPTRSKGESATSVIPGKENVVHREPAGIVGVITPWNFPFHLSMRVVAPAIALGNAVVLKPDPHTPISGGLLLAQIFEDAGLPPGVLNVVPGGSEAGERIVTHPELDVISFTGSTEVGKQVGEVAGRNLKVQALELGGNNPQIVLDDADLDATLDAATFGSFMHQGQICIKINRHLVHESVVDEYVERLTERAENLTVGDPSDPDVDIGPIINESQRDQMMAFIDDSVEQGATIETGGEANGLFVEPTVMTGVSNDMPVSCNEHFGPIAPIITFSDVDEAVALANDTEYGLTSAVHTSDIQRGKSIAKRLEAGMIHINDQPINAEPHIPFGGAKDSGLGRYNGDNIIRELTETKWVSVQDEPREFPI
ncbi:aldehyde dehydrogenase family protein [Natrinema salinisoli]|uniref:aldehyde dehydrogenase family protein n=1 Tax=Natrinema salinisoli TaxID=2878535 RepID=UPI001CF0A514|nr:aldehyde dehydrogenase family protein [Natrinema salinisoli]